MEEIPIVLIGHKDHGKSTLIGRLLLDTKSIKDGRVKEVKEVDRATNQKFELAHLIDSFKEEREKEMTIDTTRVLLKGKQRFYQLIDIPGHEELISKMLTGASIAEVAILVISIIEGIKEQTKQHLEIVKLLGIERIGVVINKMDKVRYNKKLFDKMVKDAKEILNNLGYPSKNVYFFPTSALKGINVVKKSSQTPWYVGQTLMDFFEKKIKKSVSLKKLPLIFLVQDKYSIKGEEILVGKIENGKIKIGQNIVFLPEKEKNKIASINDSENQLNKAEASENIGISLKKKTKASRGSVGILSNPKMKVNNILNCEIFWIKKPFQKELIFECGTATIKGIISNLKPIKPRQKCFSKISLKKPIVFYPSGKNVVGKIICKEKRQIIGVGNIEK